MDKYELNDMQEDENFDDLEVERKKLELKERELALRERELALKEKKSANSFNIEDTPQWKFVNSKLCGIMIAILFLLPIGYFIYGLILLWGVY